MPPMNPRGFLTEEEKENMPKVTPALLKRILGYLTPYWSKFLLVFATILVSAVLGLLPSIITGRIVDEALVGKDMALLIKLLLPYQIKKHQNRQNTHHNIHALRSLCYKCKWFP